MRRLPRLLAAMLPTLALGGSAGAVDSQDEALSSVLYRMRISRPQVTIEHAAWNEPYGAWCFRLVVSGAAKVRPRPLIVAVSRNGTIENPSRGCAPSPPPVPRLHSASMDEFVRLIASNLLTIRNYPLPAKERRAEGLTRVLVTVRRDGAILEACLARSSGDVALDRQALHMARTVTVPHFPPEKAEETLTLHLPIRFALSVRSAALSQGRGEDRGAPGADEAANGDGSDCGRTISTRTRGGPAAG